MAKKTQQSNLLLLLVAGGVCVATGGYLWTSRQGSGIEEMQNLGLPEGEMAVIEEVIIVPEEGAVAGGQVIEVTTPDQLDALVSGDRKAVVKFYANWCGACNHLASYLGDVAAECSDVTFYSINVDNAELMAKAEALNIPKEKIMYLPTIVFLQPGKTHEQMTGAPAKDALVEKIKAVF